MPARVQRVEVGDAVDAEHHRLAVDHEPLESIQRRLDDPRITIGPVVTTPVISGARGCRRAPAAAGIRTEFCESKSLTEAEEPWMSGE